MVREIRRQQCFGSRLRYQCSSLTEFGSAGALLATVANDLLAFVSRKKRLGSPMRKIIIWFNQVKHSWLDIVTRVIGLQTRERESHR